MEKHYDVIIVGGGSMGAAAAYYLAKEQKDVLVIDRFSIPNTYGSHHGHTRMLRLGYGNGGKYVPLVKKSLDLWKELEQETGKDLYRQTGAITIGNPNSRFVKEAIDSSIKFNLVHEEMNASMIMERWPGIQIPDDYFGCYDPESGLLFSEECIMTYKGEALRLGADVMENQAVEGIDVEGEVVTVRTPNGDFTSNKIIITAGAWIPTLLPDLNLPIQIIRKTIGWFKPTVQQLYNGDFPCFIFDTDTIGHYYGFPDFDGGGLKLGRMDLGVESNPDQLNREFGAYEDDEGDIRGFLEQFLPHAAGELLDGATSMFSMTHDHDFIVDVHPTNDNVIIAGGFSGHGFKFASAIGHILSELATHGTSTSDISFLSLGRFESLPKILNK